jgi:hypothetical protein
VLRKLRKSRHSLTEEEKRKGKKKRKKEKKPLSRILAE